MDGRELGHLESMRVLDRQSLDPLLSENIGNQCS
jgi:hypothetical protein